jgi:hypothetical protein
VRWQKIKIRIVYYCLGITCYCRYVQNECTHIAHFWIYAKFSIQPTSEVIMLPTKILSNNIMFTAKGWMHHITQINKEKFARCWRNNYVLDTQLSRQEIPAICYYSEILNAKTRSRLVEWKNQNIISFDVAYSYRCDRVIRVWKCQLMDVKSQGKSGLWRGEIKHLILFGKETQFFHRECTEFTVCVSL